MAEHKYTELEPEQIEATLKTRKRGIEADLIAQEANLIGVAPDARRGIEERIEELKSAAKEVDDKIASVKSTKKKAG